MGYRHPDSEYEENEPVVLHVSIQVDFVVDKRRTACSVFWRRFNVGNGWVAGRVAGNSS